MDDAKKDFLVFLAIFLGLGLLWYLMGGRDRAENLDDPFLNNPTEKKSEEVRTSSPGGQLAEISDHTDGQENNSQKEYLEIKVSNNNKNYVNISQWSLEGKSGERFILGQAVTLPRLDKPNITGNILAKPGETIIVVSGRSPIGLSYKESVCTKFLEFQQSQYQPCLLEHENDRNFLKPSWKVYLERNEEIWRENSEKITLYDEKGLAIDSYSY